MHIELRKLKDNKLNNIKLCIYIYIYHYSVTILELVVSFDKEGYCFLLEGSALVINLRLVYIQQYFLIYLYI